MLAYLTETQSFKSYDAELNCFFSVKNLSSTDITTFIYTSKHFFRLNQQDSKEKRATYDGSV
jgi:hypothetical protein